MSPSSLCFQPSPLGGMYSTRLPRSVYCQRAELCCLNDYSPSFVGTQLEIMHRSCIQSLDSCSSTAAAHTRADHTEITNTKRRMSREGFGWLGPGCEVTLCLYQESRTEMCTLCVSRGGLGEWPPALGRVAAAERSRRLEEAMVVTCSSDWD